MKTALSIAGFDPSAGAGVLADIKTFHAFGVYGTAILTATTVQNSSRIDGIHSLPKGNIEQQILCLADEFDFDSIKIGMIGSASHVREIWRAFQEIQITSLVLDPVLSATSGRTLTDSSGLSEVIKLLFPFVTILTPNIPEAEILTGLQIHSPKDVEIAAERICNLGVHSVLIKGGHGVDSSDDFLLSPEGSVWFPSKRLSNREIHGTGCTLSAAIAANLALGHNLKDALSYSKTYIKQTIQKSIRFRSEKALPNHFPDFQYNQER